MAVNSNKKFSDPSFESTTLKNLQQSEDSAFVPVFTEKENYKVDVKELNSQILKKGSNININKNVISATDTKLTAGKDIKIENNVISYTGSEGSSDEIIKDDNNVVITNQNKIRFSLPYGEQVKTAHHDNNLYYNKGTSTYFTRDTDGNSLVPHFAGFTNNMIFFGTGFDPTLNAKLALVISDKVSLQYYDPQTEAERKKHWTLQDDLTFLDDSNTPVVSRTGMNILAFSQIIFNIPNLHSLYIHSYWLKKQSFKELLIIQVNKKSTDNDFGLSTIGIWNGEDEPDANYYFYHNGLVYYKENMEASNLLRISDRPTDRTAWTMLNGPGISDLHYTDTTKSYPFVSPTYWSVEINTVNRFYCMHEKINNVNNFYIIESMY